MFALAWLAPAVAIAGIGFGGNATGGTGYPVVEVLTLADSAPGAPLIPGSLRAALSGGNRIVRFRVSGYIRLTHNLVVRGPNVTIDGRDAPNRGIALWNYSLFLLGNNLIVRHIRFRGSHPTETHEGLLIGGSADVLIDHVSCSWATDECIGMFGDSNTGPVRRVTIQHSLIAEAPENRPGTSGMLVAGDVSEVTWYRNVFAKNINRNPQITTGCRKRAGGCVALSGVGRYELIQNVVYDMIYGTRLWNQSSNWSIELDAIGNLWLAGPRRPNPKIPIMIFNYPRSLGPIRVFLKGNFGPPRASRTGQPCDDFSLESANAPCAGWAPQHNAAQRQISQYLLPVGGAAGNLDGILAEVGARRPCRDYADARVIDELHTGRSSRVVLPKGFPNLTLPCP